MAATSQDKAEQLLVVLQQWRRDASVVACPVCGSKKLTINDLSARPHTEWYRFLCKACGLNETVALPQASAGPPGAN